MLSESAFDSEVQKFILKHREEDIASLLLKREGDKNWDWKWIGQQIGGYQKFKKKAPSIASQNAILYPKKISIEQSSSELTANYKSQLFKGSKMLDLSGGFGIDCMILAPNFEHVEYVEPDLELCQLMKHNSEVLGLENKIKVHQSTAEEYLSKTKDKYDLIYLDPARRDSDGKKVFRFTDCSPDVLNILEELRNRSNQIVIKAAPMHDITLGIKDLKYVQSVYVLANSTECKELVYVLGPHECKDPVINCIQLNSAKEFSFNISDEKAAKAEYGRLGLFLYNPGPSISKAGGYKMLANRFNIYPIHPNTHLFFADHIEDNFPGRIHKVEKILGSNDNLKNEKRTFNIVMRNVNLSKKAVLKKYSIKEGSEAYVYCFTAENGSLKAAICSNPL